MALRPFSFQLLAVTLTFLSLALAKAGPGASHNHYARRDLLSKKTLLNRAGDGGIGDSVKWTGWTSGDGTKDGKDGDGVSYIKTLIETYITKYSDPTQRVGVFWAGGSTTEDDFDNVDEFIESYTDDNGKKFTDIFDINMMTSMGLDEKNKDGRWWRAINRASKSLAAASSGGTAYVYMNANNCRNLFSPPSKTPLDSDPDHGGQATNGEIWYYAELPTLMRNLNINKIVTFYKTKREPGKPPKFVQTTQWDVALNTDKPRDFLPDIAMDAAPIVLPPEAGRPPLKRDVLPSSTATSIGYQKGLFYVKTISVSGLTANSATVCTATSISAIVTTTVPVWFCTACSTPKNALFVSPVSLIGSPGIPSPPPGYKPLSIGPDSKVTPVSLPTASVIATAANITNSYGETYRQSQPSMTGQPSGSSVPSFASGASTGQTLPSVDQSSFYPSSSSGHRSGSIGELPSTTLLGTGTTGSPIRSSTGGSAPAVSSSFLGTGISSGAGVFPNSAMPSGTGASASAVTSNRGSISSGAGIFPSSGTPPGTGSPSTTGIRSSRGTSSNAGIFPSSGAAFGTGFSSSAGSPSSGGTSSSTSVDPIPTGSTGGPSFAPSVTPVSSGIESSGPSVTPAPSASATGPAGSGTTPPTTAAPVVSIIPTGTQAGSSASALSSNIVVIAPIWQDFIDHPTKDKGDDVITKIKGLKDLAQDFEDEVGPPPSGSDKSCSVSTNLISDIFNAAKCLTDNLNKAENDVEDAIKNNFEDLTDVTNELENIKNLEKALEDDSEEDNDNQSQTQSDSNPTSTQEASQSSEASSTGPSSSSCTAMQTASDCSAICSGTIAPTGGSTAYSRQGCSTTCFSTFTACSATNSITTITTVASGDACPWGGATSMPAASAPAGPFVTAWFDYGISCAGSNCGEFESGGASGTVPVTGSSGATPVPTGTFNPTSSRLSSNTTPTTISSGKALSSTATTIGGPGSAISSSALLPSSATTGISTTGSRAGSISTPSCAPTDSVPTGVPQDKVQSDLNGWCNGDLFQPHTNCDNNNHGGYYLSTAGGVCPTSYYLQYYFTGIILYFNVSLADGTDSYTATSDTCLSALGTVLNGCPPTTGDPLMKYGGSIITDDGKGNKAKWEIILDSDPNSTAPTSAPAPPPSTTAPPPPPTTTVAPDPPSTPTPAPCKPGGLYSDEMCDNECGDSGTCTASAGGYYDTIPYYYCAC